MLKACGTDAAHAPAWVVSLPHRFGVQFVEHNACGGDVNS
jgi:hypothetical protein